MSVFSSIDDKVREIPIDLMKFHCAHRKKSHSTTKHIITKFSFDDRVTPNKVTITICKEHTNLNDSGC
jgi:hypothetical protein